MLEKELQGIGLNEKESKVYLAALGLGQSPVQEIASKAGINRPTAYFVIEGLIKKGLMSSFYQGRKQFFIASDPDRLEEILDQEKLKLEQVKKGLSELRPGFFIEFPSCHSRESGDLDPFLNSIWIPAFVGMTKKEGGNDGIETGMTKRASRNQYRYLKLLVLFENYVINRWRFLLLPFELDFVKVIM